MESKPTYEIAAPDTAQASLAVVRLENYRDLKISNDDDIRSAALGLEEIYAQKTAVAEMFAKPKAHAAEALQGIRDLENSFLVPLNSIDKHLRGEVRGYDDARRAAAAAITQRPEEDEKDPWEAATPPARLPERYVSSTPPPAIKGPGVSRKKLPARAIVADLAKFILAAAEGIKAGDLSWLEDLEPREPSLNEKARRWGREQFENKRPGCQWFQGDTIARSKT